MHYLISGLEVVGIYFIVVFPDLGRAIDQVTQAQSRQSERPLFEYDEEDTELR